MDDKSIYSVAVLKVSPLHELTVTINTHKNRPEALYLRPGAASRDTLWWKLSVPSFQRFYGNEYKRQHRFGCLESNEKRQRTPTTPWLS